MILIRVKMKKAKKYILHPLFFIIAFTALAFKSDDNKNFELSKQLKIFNAIVKDLNLYYVDEIDAEKLIGSAINGMLKELDPYTVYYSEKEVGELKMLTTGKYAGIGSVIRLHTDRNVVVIAEPYEGFPAAKAGLKIGDEIIAVNGTDTRGMSTDKVSDMLRGEAGTKLTVTVERPGTNGSMDFVIERENIAMPAIPYSSMLKGNIGYVQLESFTENCAKKLRNTLDELKKQGATKYILDLRGNGGGLLAEAVDIVNLFVPKGKTIVTTKGKIKQANHTYSTKNEPFDTTTPMVVLVDGGSASAAEIVAGSLQDLDRAVVVGSRTFGKGLVQTTRNLPGGGALKITTSKYYIPSGRCVQALDYSHRNSDGSAIRVPDSLTNVFYTAAGREVRDGGGIRPDVEPKEEKLTTMLFYLIQDMAIFDYATQYKLSHTAIGDAATFSISDEDYEDFKKFIIDSGFTYNMNSRKKLNELKEMIEFEGYEEITRDEIASLEKKLQQDLVHDLDLFKEEITRLISEEIVLRYYGNKGVIEHSLPVDTDLAESYKILGDTEYYNRILSPAK